MNPAASIDGKTVQKPLRRDVHDSYCEEWVESIPRLLSLMNCEPGHPLRGSFDKPFWFYRTLRDYADGMYCVGTLSGLVSALELAAPLSPADLAASLGRWARAQHRSGYHDEWFPFEASYVATAFALASVCLTLRLAEQDSAWAAWSRAQQGRHRGAVERAVRALARDGGVKCDNQRAVAAAAVRVAAALYGEQSWDHVARQLLRRLLDRQTREGWFPEYGGFDVGYSSVLLDFLAVADWVRPEGDLRSAAAKLTRLLLIHVRPDGAVGGPLYARGTEYLLPFGLLYFAALGDPSASEILERHASGSRRVPLMALDDRYFVEYSYSWALALALARGRIVPDPAAAPVTRDQAIAPSTYVQVRRHGPWSTWLSLPHGAGFVSYRNDGATVHDYGVLVQAGNRLLSYQTPARVLADEGERLEVELEAAPYRGAANPLPWALVPFRLINYAAGLTTALAPWLSGAIKHWFVTGSPRSGGMTASRRVVWQRQGATVTYRLPGQLAGGSIALGGEHRLRHVPSAHFYSGQRLVIGAGCYRIPPDGVVEFSLDGERIVTSLERLD